MVSLRNPARLNRLEELDRYCYFMLVEAALGIVAEADETGDTFARNNLLRYNRYRERLDRIKREYLS